MAILGLRGVGNFATNEAPENWREGILFYYPNGETPLVALSSQGKSEATDHFKFHWWDKSLPNRRTIINSAVTDVATTYATTDGTTIDLHPGIVQMNERTFERFLVTAVAGGTGAVTIARGKGVTSAAAMVAGDALLTIGTAYEDGASAVSGLSYDPTERVNVCQIFQRSVGPLTRRMAKTALRTGDKFMDMKHDAWLSIALDLEWSALFGDYLDEAGSVSSVRRTFSGGLYYWATTNVFDGLGLVGYFDLLDNLENFFRYGSSEKLLLAGSTAINTLNKLAINNFTVNAVSGESSFGMKIIEIMTPFGVVYIKNHPLLSDHPVFRKWMFGVDLDYFNIRYIDDITYIPQVDVNTSPTRRQDIYYADLGWEWQVERTHGVFKNFDNAA